MKSQNYNYKIRQLNPQVTDKLGRGNGQMIVVRKTYNFSVDFAYNFCVWSCSLFFLLSKKFFIVNTFAMNRRGIDRSLHLLRESNCKRI